MIKSALKIRLHVTQGLIHCIIKHTENKPCSFVRGRLYGCLKSAWAIIHERTIRKIASGKDTFRNCLNGLNNAVIAFFSEKDFLTYKVILSALVLVTIKDREHLK
jgi:hypothetical protein